MYETYGGYVLSQAEQRVLELEPRQAGIFGEVLSLHTLRIVRYSLLRNELFAQHTGADFANGVLYDGLDPAAVHAGLILQLDELIEAGVLNQT